MGVQRLRLGDRTRPLVALITLTAWFGTLLVAGPRAASAEDPSIAAPTLSVAAGSGTGDPVFTVGDVAPDTAQCALVFGAPASPPAEGASDWATCPVSPASWTPTLAAGDGTYTAFARTARATTTTVVNPSDSSTSTIAGPTAYSPPSAGVTYTRTAAPAPMAAPTVTFTSAPTPANPATPYTFAAAPAAGTTDTFRCGIAATGTAPGAVPLAGCSSPWTPFASASGGAYAVVVEVTRTDGTTTLTDTDVVDPVTLDAAVPVLTVQRDVTAPTDQPTWNVSVDDGVTVAYCAFTGMSAAQPCGATFSRTLTTEGTYALRVTATDAAGNVATPVDQTYTYDLTAPAAPALGGSSGAQKTNDISWTVGRSHDPDIARITCVVTHDGVEVSRTDACGAQVTPVVATTATGIWRLEATSYDSVGNPSTSSTSIQVRYDTTAPTVTINRDLAAPADRPVFLVSTDSDATAMCSVAGVQPSATACGASYEVDLTGRPGGTYTLTVVATDAATNSTTATAGYVLAPARPTVSVTSPGSSLTPTWTISAQSGATLSCTLTSPSGAVTNPTCSGTSTAPTLSGTSGTWTLSVTATVDGAASPAGSASYELDRIPPGDVVLGGDSGPQRTSPITWSVTPGADTTSVVCEVRHDGTLVRTDSPCGTQVQVSLPDLVAAEGTWTLTAVGYDRVQNPSATASRSVVIDVTQPAAPGVTRLSSSPTQSTATTWSLSTGESPGTFRCRWTGGTLNTSAVPCEGVYGYAIPTADATYTLHVAAVDAAGNVGPEATGTVVMDRSAPTVTFATPPTSPTSPSNLATVTWTSTVSEPSSKTECRLVKLTSGADLVVHGWTTASCGRTVTRTLVDGDGTYVLQVRDTDLAQNVDPDGTAAAGFELDTTGPGSPSVSGPAGFAQQPSVSWTVTPAADPAEPGVGYLCRLVRDSNEAAASWVACDSDPAAPGIVFATTLPADATYRLDVVSTDALGNRSAPVVSSDPYTLDRQAPAAAVFTSPAGTGNVTERTWTWTVAEPNLTATCVLYTVATDGARTEVRTTADCGTARTEQLANATPGITYQLEVVLTDRALNSTAADGPLYRLDTVRPVAPTVAGPSGTDNIPSARYVTTPSEPGTTLTCELMQRAVGATSWTTIQTQTTCPLTWDVPLPSVDAEYAGRVTLTDAAGNVSLPGESEVYTLDVTGPVAATFTSGPTGTDNLPGVTWTWTSEALSTATCAVDRVPVGSTTASRVVVPEPCNAGSYSTTLSAGDGTYTLTVELTDQYGNVGGSRTSEPYTLDATAPGAPAVSGPSVTSNRTTADYAITGPVEPGATAECQLLLDDAVSSAWASCTLPRTVSLGADGTYVLQVRLTDQYGNTGPAGSSPSYLLDTQLPTVPVVTAPASPSSNPSPAFTFTIDADTTASCSLARGTTVVGTSPSCAGSFTGALTGLADGDYVLTVVSKDAAGNTATGASSPYTYDTTAPVAPSVTGPTGPSQNRNPVFSWTGEPGATAECSLQEEKGTPGAFAGCATPYAPTLPGDGTWVLTVRLTDSALNVSAAGASGGYLLDTTPPPAPAVTAPSSPGRDLAPSWSAGLEDGSKAECRFTGPSTSSAFAPCTFPLTTPVVADGTYQLDVRSTDAAGNVSAVGSGSYVLDTTAPAAPVVAQPTGPSRNRNPSIVFTAETGTTGSCRLTRGSTVLSDSAACSSPASLDLTGLPDGAYTLSVRAVDAAGNTGPAGTATYVLDTTAPAAPTMTLVAGSPSSDRAPVYAFNVEAGSTPACRFATAGGAVRDLPCVSPLTLDLSGSIEGEYVLSVTARDAAGNTSAAAASTYVLDASAPAAPRVAGPVTPGSTRTPAWRISSTAPAECRLLRGTTVLRDWAACGTTYTADLYAQPDATYLLEARVVGTTAQTTSRYRLDTAGPAAATITPPPSPSTVRTPTWAVASPEATVTAECRVSVFGGVMQDWSTCGVSNAGSLFTVDLTGLGDGTYTLSVRLTDSAGNVGPIATSDYVLDTSAPAAVGVVGPPSPGNDTTPTWTLNSTTGAELQCRVTSGQKLITDFAPCAGTFTADLTGLPDGPYTLTVHALSAAGTPGPDTTSTYLLDTTASGAPGTLTGPTGPSRDRSPTWTFVLPAGSTAVCKVTSGGKVYTEGPCTSPYTLDLSNAPDGSYTLTVRAVDAAGNLGSASTAGYILRTVPAPPPVFTQLPGSPASTTDPRWGFTTVRGVLADCRILYSGVVRDDWAPCTSPYTMMLTGQPDGKYTLQVRSHDSAGNTSAPVSSDYAFDRSAAPLAVFLETPATPGTDATPTWVVSAPTAAAPTTAPALLRTAALTGTPTTQCRLTTPRGAGQWEPCSGRYTATTTGDGTYLLEVRAADSAGQTGPASSAAYVLDTDAPAAPRYTETPPPVGNDAEISWSWTDDPELLVECRFLRGSSATSWATCTSPYSASLSRLGQNTYTLEARAVDMAGNISGVSASSYRYDTTAPPQPVFASRPPARGSSSSATWTFAVPVDTSAVCVVTRDGTVVSEGACNGSFTIERMTSLATWSLSVRYVDAAGNVGPAAVGSYTLTTPVLVRDRVDGPGAPGGGPFAPRPPTGGLGSPTGENAPTAPTGPTTLGPEPGQPRAGGVLPGITEPVKRTVRNAVKNLPVPVPGIPAGTRVPDAIKNTIKSTITKPQLPLALFFVVLLFLLVQNRIDRRDPKLAAAPVTAEPELAFGPRVITSMRTGGATA